MKSVIKTITGLYEAIIAAAFVLAVFAYCLTIILTLGALGFSLLSVGLIVLCAIDWAKCYYSRYEKPVL